MTVLRASAASLAALIALAAVALPAGAQVGAPVRLGPAPPPPGSDADADSQGQPAVEALPPGGIRVEGLGALDTDAVGTLGDARGGLGVDMWNGTTRALVERLLPQLPATTRSRAARSLMRRLLLTTASPPVGDGGRVSLVALRVERLAAMGDVDGVDALLRAAPARLSDPDLARAAVNNRLLLYDFAGACGDVDGVAANYSNPFWQKTLILCQALAQEFAQATLGLDLLREDGGDSDAIFFSIIETLTSGGDVSIESPGQASVLNLALLRAVGSQVPGWLVDASAPGMLRTIALSPNADLASRLSAARRAEAIGALETEALASLYVGIGFAADEITSAFDGDVDQVRAPALQYLAALDQTVPAARAEALRRGWQSARVRDDIGTATRLGLPLLLELTPSAELAWFAGDAGRALLFGDRVDAALAWYQIAQREAVFDDDVVATEALLWPLIALAADPEVMAGDLLLTRAQTADIAALVAWDEARFERWRAASGARDAAALTRRTGLLLSLFDALGIVDGSGRWAALLEDAPRVGSALPPAAVLFALDDAAGAGRTGEAALFALLALGSEVPGAMHPVVLHRVVGALRQVGLAADARALAVEAALTAGF